MSIKECVNCQEEFPQEEMVILDYQGWRPNEYLCQACHDSYDGGDTSCGYSVEAEYKQAQYNKYFGPDASR